MPEPPNKAQNRTNNAEVAILIPHYNDLPRLQTSLNSIEEKIATDVWIVDDGSNEPPTQRQLQAYVRDNIGVHLIFLPNNSGVATALNAGLDRLLHHPYNYIARLDCGDTCQPKRIEKQIKKLQEHPVADLCYCYALFVDSYGTLSHTEEPPLIPSALYRASMLNNPIMHPTAMFRRRTFHRYGKYSYDYPDAEDYAMFLPIIAAKKAVGIAEFLVSCLQRESGISSTRRTSQLQSRAKLQIAMLSDSPWAWLGLSKTIVLMITPNKLVIKIKKMKKSKH